MHEQPAAARFLLKRLIHRERRLWRNAGVIEVGNHADNPTRFLAQVDELADRIRPEQLAVHDLGGREHSLGQRLTDDHDLLRAGAIVSVEVAAGQDRNTKRGEEPRSDRPRTGNRILFAVLPDAPFNRKLHAAAQVIDVAPRHRAANRDALHTRHFRRATVQLSIEPQHLVARTAKRRHRHVDRQDAAGLDARTRGLQRHQRANEHAGAGQQQERCGNLCHRKRLQPQVGGPGQARAVPRLRQAMRRLR